MKLANLFHWIYDVRADVAIETSSCVSLHGSAATVDQAASLCTAAPPRWIKLRLFARQRRRGGFTRRSTKRLWHRPAVAERLLKVVSLSKDRHL